MNKRFFYTGCFVLLLAFAVLSAVFLTRVEAGDESIATRKTYSDISVKDYIDEVKLNNQLSSDKIVAGKKLIIATYSRQ